MAFICIVKQMAQSGLNKRNSKWGVKIWRDLWKYCRKGDPFWGLRVGSCLTVGGELSEGTRTHLCTDKAKDFIGNGGEQQGMEPRRTALPCDLQSQILRWWDYFPGCVWPTVLMQGPSCWCTHCSAKMDSTEENSGKLLGHMDLCLLLIFPEFLLLVAC